MKSTTIYQRGKANYLQIQKKKSTTGNKEINRRANLAWQRKNPAWKRRKWIKVTNFNQGTGFGGSLKSGGQLSRIMVSWRQNLRAWRNINWAQGRDPVNHRKLVHYLSPKSNTDNSVNINIRLFHSHPLNYQP